MKEPPLDTPVDETKLVPLPKPQTTFVTSSGVADPLKNPVASWRQNLAMLATNRQWRSILNHIAVSTFIIMTLIDGAVETLFPRVAADFNHLSIAMTFRSRGVLLLTLSALSASFMRPAEKDKKLEYFAVNTIAFYCVAAIANLLHHTLVSSPQRFDPYCWIRIMFHVFWVVGTWYEKTCLLEDQRTIADSFRMAFFIVFWLVGLASGRFKTRQRYTSQCKLYS